MKTIKEKKELFMKEQEGNGDWWYIIMKKIKIFFVS